MFPDSGELFQGLCLRKGDLGIGDKWCGTFLISDILGSNLGNKAGESSLGRNKIVICDPHLSFSVSF